MKARWQSKTKFYGAYLQRDLFKDWNLTLIWGSLNSRLGNSKNHIFDTQSDALKYIEKIHKRRQQRGYQLIK